MFFFKLIFSFLFFSYILLFARKVLQQIENPFVLVSALAAATVSCAAAAATNATKQETESKYWFYESERAQASIRACVYLCTCARGRARLLREQQQQQDSYVKCGWRIVFVVFVVFSFALCICGLVACYPALSANTFCSNSMCSLQRSVNEHTHTHYNSISNCSKLRACGCVRF